MDQIIGFINQLSLVLILVPPTIFVFGVTLLGTAIEKARQEEESARENEAKTIAEDIKKVEEVLENLKKNGDRQELIIQLDELKKSKAITDKKIRQIRSKYNRINLRNTVTFPTLSFLFAFLFGNIFLLAPYLHIQVYFLVFLFLELASLFYGLLKIYKALSLIQEISENKRDSEGYDRLKETFKQALQEYNQGLKEEVGITFANKVFPLNVTAQTDLSISFRVKLIKGSVLNNLKIWFFIPDGFELVNPPESLSWRQGSDFPVPNIRTVKVNIGTLSIGPYISGTLKIKTPVEPGKYSVRYKAQADGYSGSSQDFSLFVE